MIELRPFELKWMEFARATLEMSLHNKIKQKLKEFNGNLNTKELQEALIKTLTNCLRELSPLPGPYDTIINQLRDMDPEEYIQRDVTEIEEDQNGMFRAVTRPDPAVARGWVDPPEWASDQGIPDRYA